MPELNLAEFQSNWNDELQKDLVVKIFDQKAGIVFTFLLLHGPCPVGVEHEEDQRAAKYNDQAYKCKVFDQSERFDFFF
jgi:hypothetical protein